jgi:MFS family permease
MLAMVGFGFGEIFGCFFIGFIVDKFGSKVAAFLNVLIIILMTLITCAFIQVYEFNWLPWVMCFIWGFQDSMVNTHSQEMLGFEFDNNSEPFSIFNILQCFACFIF